MRSAFDRYILAMLGSLLLASNLHAQASSWTFADVAGTSERWPSKVSLIEPLDLALPVSNPDIVPMVKLQAGASMDLVEIIGENVRLSCPGQITLPSVPSNQFAQALPVSASKDSPVLLPLAKPLSVELPEVEGKPTGKILFRKGSVLEVIGVGQDSATVRLPRIEGILPWTKTNVVEAARAKEAGLIAQGLAPATLSANAASSDDMTALLEARKRRAEEEEKTFTASPAPAGLPTSATPEQIYRAKLVEKYLLGHFRLGVEAPDTWIKETRKKNGANWDMQGGYLSFGGGDYENPWWLQSGGLRQRLMMAEDLDGVLQVLTFYYLSEGPPAYYKPNPGSAAAVNMRNRDTMRTYFAIFKKMLLICAEHKQVPIAVHVEPDEWCHILGAAGMDPDKTEIIVGGTGMEELAGLPDNIYGYARALARLRDLYAPRVLLGCNPSAWDVTGSMTGKKMGATFKKVCSPNFDFAVFENGDRDKGMKGWKLPYKETIDIAGDVDKHTAWIKEFTREYHVPLILWQVAIGNTYFRTCNNTPKHYCDNLAQLILEGYPANKTIEKYIRSGCVGWLFLRGQTDSTSCWDAAQDGITNPEPIPGNAGHVSEYADDDGGFLRLMAGEYYKNPAPLR